MQRENAKPGMRVRIKPGNRGGVARSYAYVVRDGYTYASATSFSKIEPADDPPPPQARTITKSQAYGLQSLLNEAKELSARQQAIIDVACATFRLKDNDWVWEYFLQGDRPLESLLEKIGFTIEESERGEHQEAAVAEVPERDAGAEGCLPVGSGDASKQSG